jgi:transglutaminase-like putative cysteine protease
VQLNSAPFQISPANQPKTSTLGFIPEGKDGIIATLKVMRGLVRKYKTDLGMRNLAVSITNGVAGKDYRGEVEAVQTWVKNNVRYVRDIRDVETLHTPDITVQIRAGDCDDQSVLVATLLETIGHATGFVAVGFLPDEFAHVYAITRMGQNWLSVETTEPVPVGWRPENVVSRLVIFN